MTAPQPSPDPDTNSNAYLEPTLTTEAAAQAAFLPAMRELVRTYQAFAACSEAHVRELGLTPAQFDVIATLGRTNGMNMTELAAKTLVTKGTLTGIIDRLEHKQLVRRQVVEGDRRSFTIFLTPAGETIFESAFPAHIAHMQRYFQKIDPLELELLRVLLAKLRSVFQSN